MLSLRSSHCGDPTALKAVLFDLDGTLIDTLDMIKASLRYATETVLGRVIPDEVLMHNVGIPLVVQMAEFDPERAEELLATYREHNVRVHDAMVREYPYVEESLERLVGLGLQLGNRHVKVGNDGPARPRPVQPRPILRDGRELRRRDDLQAQPVPS